VSYLELDDIVYNIQKFGGATTYWNELTSRLSEFIPGSIVRRTASKFSRLRSPSSSARVFHSSHFRVSSSSSAKNVTTIHDLIYEKGLGGGRGKLINLYERKKAVARADAIICISESTRRDLCDFYGNMVASKPIHVIYHGCNTLKEPSLGQSSIVGKFSHLNFDLVSGNFFIFVGGRSGYKNFRLLLNAFLAGGFFERGFHLVCTGSLLSDGERELIDKLKLTNAVSSLGFVDAGSLRELYRIARALVYPSTYEGFGLPPLEAMAAGCPVICSNSSSLPEVVGKSGILIDPFSVEHLADAMNSVLSDDARKHFVEAGILRAKLFDWRETARKHAEVYESLASF
jgi:glycosyltransferase involved in cell wall biosynthesis